MKVKFFEREEVAKEVGQENNNTQLESALKLYLLPVYQAGFKIVKEVEQ